MQANPCQETCAGDFRATMNLSSLITFCAAVTIECFVLRRGLKLSNRSAMKLSLCVNGISTLLSIPLLALISYMLIAAGLLQPELINNIHSAQALAALPMSALYSLVLALVALLIPVFLLGIVVESKALQLFTGVIDRKHVKRVVLKANLLSYLLLVLIPAGAFVFARVSLGL